MSKPGAYSYEDEIDLYGDVDARPNDDNGNGDDSKIGQEETSKNVNDDSKNGSGGAGGYSTSSIPTFISEARGGTGVIPPRDESAGPPGSGSQSNDPDGQGPRRGDYGSPGQWSTKPISTVRPSDMPDEGKMFIGGLNWETTEESMRKYFEQFGEVTHCTIMRDPSTNRSRGFGFLTFSNATAVNTVMVKEHYLDGKIIDPKRAIPRPDVGAVVRPDKLFVRQIPQSVDFDKFKEHFSQFGHIIDSNLMMDRETGFHRGFGFVTFDDAGATQNALSQDHYLDGQQLEVKMATQKTRNQDTYVGDRPNRNRQFQHQNNFQNQGQGGGMGGNGPMGGGGFNNMGMGNNMGNMGGGGMNPMGGGMGNMGGMGMQGMQGMGMGGNQQAFDPYAMSQFFKQMGWGNFNPMMLMQGGMMGGQGGMMPNMMDPNMMGMMGGMNNMSPMGNMGGMNNMGNMNNMGGMGGMGGGAEGFSPQGSFGNSNQGGSAMGGPSGMKANDGPGNNHGGPSGNFRGPPPKGPRSQQGNSSRSPIDNKPPANAPTGPASMRDRDRDGAGPIRGGGRGNARDHPYR